MNINFSFDIIIGVIAAVDVDAANIDVNFCLPLLYVSLSSSNFNPSSINFHARFNLNVLCFSLFLFLSLKIKYELIIAISNNQKNKGSHVLCTVSGSPTSYTKSCTFLVLLITDSKSNVFLWLI